LWNAWKAVRQQLKRSNHRDIADDLEYDIDPEVWISRLLRQINTGTYEPATPLRFQLAKSKGFSRQMTKPQIPDLILYRTIVDLLYRKARRLQKKHVYFSQATLSKVVLSAEEKARRKMAAAAMDYESSKSAFLEWLKYDQYRKHLIFDRVFPFIVTTDITNFFDSILYSRVEESLYGLDVPPKIIGLLFFLLERLSIRDQYTQSPRIGLPVDEFDCSRNLAHMVLFPHDNRLVEIVGEHAYVRWMDDQNIGVKSRADGLRVLAQVGQSLSRLHLTANASKSQVLSLVDARRHFHFDINRLLDAADKLPVKTKANRRVLQREINRIWRKAKRYEGKGHWDKILKRIYRLAALSGSKILRTRAVNDLLRYPSLTRRIADYMRYSGSIREYLAFVFSVIDHPEQIYGDVNLTLVESLLRIEPDAHGSAQLRTYASELLRGVRVMPGRKECAAVASLLVLRFGDRRTARALQTCFQVELEQQQIELAKACALTFASYGGLQFEVVRRAASRLLRNPLSEIVRMVERIKGYPDVPGRLKARIEISPDAITGKPFIDMRSFLTARLLALNSKPAIHTWLRAKKKAFHKSKISTFDKRLVKKLL
jgi:hypothetical protein